MEYHSATKRDEAVSFAETWMDLESVMQNEVLRKRKANVTYECTESRRRVQRNLFAKQKWRCKDRE